MKWAYGVTSVKSRIHTLLPQTLHSLEKAGFHKPRLFIDGTSVYDMMIDENGLMTTYPVTLRQHSIGPYGNWMLGLIELYIRNPVAERFAIFQDDIIMYRSLREYLDSCEFPANGYWNLYTFHSNEYVVQMQYEGWYESGSIDGDTNTPHRQTGRGALALVFSREGLLTLLQQKSVFDRCANSVIGHCKIDGAVVTAMNDAGWREYIHNPSLVQHCGYPSTISQITHRKAVTWRGESFDARELCKGRAVCATNPLRS